MEQYKSFLLYKYPINNVVGRWRRFFYPRITTINHGPNWM